MKKKDEKRKSVDLETGEGLIIEREALLPRVRRAGQSGWLFASWILFVETLRPLFAGALWVVSADWARRSVFSKDSLRNPDFFLYYSIVILGIFLVFLAWNRYNFLRFRGADRRQPRGECESYDLARYYDVSMEEIEVLSRADVEISFDPDDRIVIETDSKREISALYAPQDPRGHFVRLKAKESAAKAYVEES